MSKSTTSIKFQETERYAAGYWNYRIGQVTLGRKGWVGKPTALEVDGEEFEVVYLDDFPDSTDFEVMDLLAVLRRLRYQEREVTPLKILETSPEVLIFVSRDRLQKNDTFCLKGSLTTYLCRSLNVPANDTRVYYPNDSVADPVYLVVASLQTLGYTHKGGSDD